MRLPRLFAPLLLPLACATPQAEKMSFEEAFKYDIPLEKRPGVAKAAAGKRKRASPPEATTSVELQAALLSFGARSRTLRTGVPRGSPMPEAQAANWREVGGAVDTFLDRTAAETSSFDLIRARVALEAELEADALAYGDFPARIADGVLDRVTQLAVRMAQVRRLGVQTRRVAAVFAWPVEPVVVTSAFGRRLHPLSRAYKLHHGIDLAADEGQLVSAAAAGTVIFAGWYEGYGLQIEVQHDAGVVTRYGHLSQVLVEPGFRVGRRDPLGLAGSTGVSTGPHLHFEVLRDGAPCDPLLELGDPVATGPTAALFGAAPSAMGGTP